MRIAAFVLALVSALAAMAVGGLLLQALQQPDALFVRQMAIDTIRSPEMPEPARRQLRSVLSRQQALPYALFAAVPLMLFGSLLVFQRRGVLAGLLLMLSAMGPMVVVTAYGHGTLNDGGATTPIQVLFLMFGIPCGLLVLAAIFAFIVQPKATPSWEDQR